VTQAPIYIGEFGTGNSDGDLYTTGAGSQGQWTTNLVNFIRSSYFWTKTTLNDSGVPVSDLHWSYWALNDEDNFGLLGTNYTGLDNAKKEYSFLCFIQQGVLAVPMSSGTGGCGSTGMLPAPGNSTPPPVPVPAAPTNVNAVAGDARVSLTWVAVTGATSYSVRYATISGGPYQSVVTGMTTTSFTQTGLTNGTRYYFVVTATSSAGESANSSQVSAIPVAPVVLTNLSVWWPTNGATLSGTQPFKARIENMVLTNYTMFWQVDGGTLNPMVDSHTGGAHKEASVSVNGWTWRGNGPYLVNFVAKDRKGLTLAQKSVTIYIAR
jgi:hypothetical protein